jgi:tetratricopeptide (TPR) repeat protein
MSLINQMLKDLETRSRANVDPEIALSGLTSSSEEMESSWKKLTFLVVLLCGVLALIWVGQQQFHFFKQQPDGLNQKANAAQVQSAANHPNDSLPMAEHVATSVLMGIALQVQEDVTNLRFLLNKDTLYNVNSDPEHHQLILTFDHTNLIADLPPLNYLQSAIQDIAMSNTSDGDLKVTITLNANAELKHLDRVGANRSSELQVDLAYKKPIMSSDVTPDVSSKPTIMKTPVGEFNAQQQFERATNLLNSGQASQALLSLTDLISKYPEFYPAREPLANLLLRQGEYKKADVVITAGLRQRPDDLSLISLKAHLLVNQGKTHEALRILEVSEPDSQKNPDYISFLAALYQRTGQPQMAMQLYEQLLKSQPPRAVWWIGLGVAFESLDKPNEAKEAYIRAGNTENLSPELRAFVDSRLSDA